MNIQDGVYNATPVAAAVYEKNDKLMLEVRFNLCDDAGNFYTQTGSNGKEYPIEKRKYYPLITADGAVNTKTVEFIRAWADSWDGLDPYWFTENANLSKIGMVEVTLKSQPGWQDKTKIYQNIEWVNPVGHNAKHTGAKPIASDDRAAIMAKYGAKFKAAAGAVAKPVAATAAAPAAKPVAAAAAPVAAAPVAAAPVAAAPAALPTRPAPSVAETKGFGDGLAGQAEVWGAYSASASAKGLKSAEIEKAWFAAIDNVTGDGTEGSGKDQNDITGDEWAKIHAALMA